MGLLRYLGFSNGADQNDENNPIRPLQSDWYSSPESTYELERRAIFTRQWQLSTHTSRLQNIGDFVKLDVAGYEFVLSRNRQGEISGFHNVCRHRAYPVVTKDCGSSKIFSCKYHGWSYGLNGKLAKAPGYQELAGFEKEKNGLFPVHVHIDDNGFVWVNLQSSESPEQSWEDDFGISDTDLARNYIDANAYEYDHSWQLEGDNDWKVYAEDYNRRYHPTTTTAPLPPLTNRQKYLIDIKTSEIIHESRSTDLQRERGHLVELVSLLPNASTSISNTFLIVQRFVPTSAAHTNLVYQLFRNKASSIEDFDSATTLFKRIMTENKESCDRTRQALDAEVTINGDISADDQLHSPFFRDAVRELVEVHHEAERAARKQLWPTRQQVPETATANQSHEDAAFCASLCPAVTQDELNW